MLNLTLHVSSKIKNTVVLTDHSHNAVEAEMMNKF